MAYCIPNLKLDDLSIDVDWSSAELNSNCQVMLSSKSLVSEL